MKKVMMLPLMIGLLIWTSLTLAVDTLEGKALYEKSCANCHGVDGMKLTGDSPVLKGQSADIIFEKMQGYLVKSYGKRQKPIMENIAKKHTIEELKAVSRYISGL